MTKAYEFWTGHTPQSLKQLLVKRPLNNRTIEHFLKKNVMRVLFATDLDGAAITPTKTGDKCFITVGLGQKQIERERSLVSMIVKGIYRVRGLDYADRLLNEDLRLTDTGQIEHMVENTTREFYANNMGYVRQLYNSLFEGYNDRLIK